MRFRWTWPILATILLTCMLIVALIVWTVVSRSSSPRIDTKTTSTKIILRELSLSIWLVEQETKRQPPVNHKDMIMWLYDAKAIADHQIYIDRKKMEIDDAWGRPLRFITQRGSLVGIGSCGPNGKWEDGEGDDIIHFVSTESH